MSISTISVLILATLPALHRGWAGWRNGAAVEIRYLLMFLFAVLFATACWQACLAPGEGLDPRKVAIWTFIGLFVAGCGVAAITVQIRSKIYRSVKPGRADQILGAVAGVFSGALLGACILWMATIAEPGKFESVDAAKRLAGAPRAIFQAIETLVGVPAGSPARTRYPVTMMIGDDASRAAVVWK